MEVLKGLLTGIGAGVFVTWFPGMLNMQVVATACRAGRDKAYAFSAGLSTVIGLQATLAVFFAHLIETLIKKNALLIGLANIEYRCDFFLHKPIVLKA